jgi:predicted AAA+ superfamily ATPase
MPLQSVLLEKLNDGIASGPPLRITRRDAELPRVPGKVHAVIGMRRAGKTFFLRQLLSERRSMAPTERAVFVSFDDDRLANLTLDQLGLLIEEYYRRYPQSRGRETVYWFFDEIQLVEGWERFVRRVIDSERVEICVSGSSARMLSREVHTSLRGRGMETVIRPFSFMEFLRDKGEESETSVEHATSAQRSLLEKRLSEYLVEGGFPEAQGLSKALRIQLLQGYVDTVLFRDVVERYEISQVAALRWLIRQCLRNPAGAFSVHRLYQDLKAQGHGIAKDAVHALFGHLLDAFLISAVPIATESERRRNSNPRKVYPADPALIGAFDVSGRSNIGHALETVVSIELDRRRAEVGYVKTDQGFEVDFLARYPSGEQDLIQVCAEAAAPDTAERELRALTEAGRQFPSARKCLLTLTQDGLPHDLPSDVLAQPAHVWLLTPTEQP